ncbi:hypothetical protein VFPPC_09568 [Pochonia chlamydosporia 170]|uniref:Uncharacterized protein n=1 Tax=Pochonia chlamydosporia 170 TaxID=1380566 RepID=A0A179F9K5_METCM|nr:hypothetical protein VFPPC_09568 [Pochonia chlamydosporia 170]OAQ61779.1 hypothetical protein VFPPC_09568 [Pochonia chlamydosporia 170]
MAFQQPTRQPVQRTTRPPAPEDEAVAALPPASEGRPEDSQTWVLFSPPTEVTTTSYLTESEHSLETPGRSRLSDLGSLHTVARSEEPSNARQSTSVLSAIDDHQSVDDDAELDSLDSHLPEFRSVPGLSPISQRGSQQAAPVFPAHDGLGSFRLDRPVFGTDAQDQIYQFEKFNPRKFRRRLDSFDHTQVDLDQVQTQEEEKRQRIEAWRLEHSRVLLDEVQRETRRRRKSLVSIQRSRRTSDAETDNMTWHDEDAFQPDTEQEGFMARITRTVVKDILGIDDNMLSILLGEELPDEYEESLSTTPRASQHGNRPILTTADEPSWQIRILERLSRELGLLVNHLSPHPGAFSAYSRMQHMSLPYAGLPVIPESSDAGVISPMTEPGQPSQASQPKFQPTMHQHSQPIGIPGRRHKVESSSNDVDMTDGDFTKEEWEKSLDIKLVFRYLVSRFASRSGSSSPPGTSHHGVSTQQDTAAKVARVRQHHPLIARTRPVERRSFKAVGPSSPVALRHHSSCASQSTRRSARRSSCSSRHYWDIGGSLGTGSVIASNGPMGSWGEV